MANVVREPGAHPDVVIPELSISDPLLTFTASDIALVYGSKWKKRYFQKVGDDYFPLPAQWDVNNNVWRPYFVRDGTDWWTAYYPPDNMKRPTGPLCDGCHSVNYNVQTKSVTEWNVGCKKCHGPGGEHVAKPSRSTIINPARLDFVHANDVCIQRHSQGRTSQKTADAKYYDWPVSFQVGLDLKAFWQLEDHRPGETTFTHFADGTAHKNRMQGNDFVTSAMYTHGVTCFSCHDVHGTGNTADLIKPADVLCLQCHGPRSPNGPRTATVQQHTHHKPGSRGSECVSCHMPKVEQTIADVNVRSHTFRFIFPTETERFGIPNARNGCHTDKSSRWAVDVLRTWPEVSPWRIGN